MSSSRGGDEVSLHEHKVKSYNLSSTLKWMIFAAVIFIVFVILRPDTVLSSESANNSGNLRGQPMSQYITTTAIHALESATVPKILYGTAWKKERTTDLVVKAVKAGFRGIDTACQPRHYNEPGVGKALGILFAEGIVKREDIFIQTKFTSVDGQDPNNIPYDPSASLDIQVRQSFAASCDNLGVNYLDSLVLHSPMRTFEDTMVVWNVMEDIHASGGAKALGISNTYDLR